MSRRFFAALTVAIFMAGLAWVCRNFNLPIWYSLVSASLFFVAPQNNIQGLVATLFSALIGILIGVIFMHSKLLLPTFPYQFEVVLAVSVFILYLITQINYINHFASALISFALLILSNGDWIMLCPAVVLGILCGFIARIMMLFISGKRLS